MTMYTCLKAVQCSGRPETVRVQAESFHPHEAGEPTHLHAPLPERDNQATRVMRTLAQAARCGYLLCSACTTRSCCYHYQTLASHTVSCVDRSWQSWWSDHARAAPEHSQL